MYFIFNVLEVLCQAFPLKTSLLVLIGERSMDRNRMLGVIFEKEQLIIDAKTYFYFAEKCDINTSF